MSKKMWNRIFKTKSANKSPGISKKVSIPIPPTFNSSGVENRLSYYEEFHNCCQQQQQSPIKAKISVNDQTTLGNSNKTQSKFSKVVNTFSLKRGSKENHNNQVNTNGTIADTKTTSISYQNGNNNNNYSTEKNVGSPIMEMIGTPTTKPDNTIEANEEPVSLELIPCPTCSRTFVRRALEKHIRICEKMTVKKRKIFDSSRQRREGTELAAYPLPKNFGLPAAAKQERGISPKPVQAHPPILSPKKPPEEISKSPARIKSVTPLALKKVTSPSHASSNLLGHSNSAPKDRSRAATIPKRIQPPPAEPCPYCERCFGIKAYDRHVEWCKEKALLASIKQNNTNSQNPAKERLEARIKYRAPCLKTKRSVNRDKYSCHNDENLDMQTSMEDHHLKDSIMTSSMTSSFMSDGSSKPHERLDPIEKNFSKKEMNNSKSTKKKNQYKFDSNIVKSMSNAPMSDDDLEQLFEKEFQRKNLINRAKMHADTQASKLEQKLSSMSKTTTMTTTPTTSRNKMKMPYLKPKDISSSKKSNSNLHHLIKEHIEFIPSAASSSKISKIGAKVSTKQVPGCLPKNKSFIVSGVSDKYDPFLSAKRQLEELCSPSSPTDGILSPSNMSSLPKTPSKPNTPSLPNTMTTSFTSASSLANPRRVLTTTKSNFRRTSSLRAPRRSPLPMATTRPTFFPTTQNQRPTIQRGLSDEGPISSNFLKPEEYDEMPVRAVCVNDFAITNTPRVVRRDSNSASNRKNLRLPLQGTGQTRKDRSPTPPIGMPKSGLLKTDSLAVFLKYENEAKGNENNVVSTKELKDKSNALSKQNSAKSVILTDDQMSTNRNVDKTPIIDNSNIGNVQLNNIKLEPIVRSPSVKPSPPAPPIRRNPPPMISAEIPKSINLNSIFATKDQLRSCDNDFIDPKLINICDNLPMELGNDLASNSSSSPSYSGADRNNTHGEKNNNDAENSTRLSSSSNSSPSPITFKRAPSPTTHTKAVSSVTNTCTNSNRSSSGENRNQLKRKIRLGRNQFLYDASPENETLENDADDEDNNRSSCEPDMHKPSQHSLLFSTPNITSSEPTQNLPPFSPPTFDEFDFEEFLSAFDNDDEQFPSLFKDCREFLLNRSKLNKRSNNEKMSSFRSTSESARKYEEDVEHNLNCDEDKNRGEIFISIETDQNENDPHPNNDPLVTANPTAQIEEVNSNDNKFQKIEDDTRVDDDRVEDEESDDRLRMRRINLLNDFPNVRLNNAKNLIQQMHEDFQNLHEGASVNADDNLNGNSVAQTDGSSLYPVDSDEISSIECYPVRRGGSAGVGGNGAVQSKHSADSAYGSLSRQSPTPDINANNRSSLSNRTKTPSSVHESLQQSPFAYSTSPAYNYANNNDIQKYRCRNFSAGSSSSGSDNSLPPISGSKGSIRHEHQSQLKELKRQLYRNPISPSSLENQIQSSNNAETVSNSSSTNNLDPSLTRTSTPVKASKFCHECGSRFLLEQAKFCMDCGVRRIVLK